MIPVRAWTLASFVMLTAGLGAAQDAQPPILFDRPFGEIDVNEDGVIDIVEFNSAVDARFVALDVATLRPARAGRDARGRARTPAHRRPEH